MLDLVRRVARRHHRRSITGALDLETASPDHIALLVKFVSSQVKSMDDLSVAYGAYAVDGLGDNPAVQDLRRSLLENYRLRMLKWFGYAIQNRARMGGGGSGIKSLKEGLSEYVKSLPDQLLGTYKPLSSFIKGNVTEIVDKNKLDPVSMKIYRVLTDALGDSGLDSEFTAEFDGELWYIPSNQDTYAFREELKKGGFKWNPRLRRWETRSKPDQSLVSSSGRASPPEVRDWFFLSWLPKNIGRFDTVFNTYLKSEESSYSFKFKMQGEDEISVDIKREIAGPKEAVEELRYRYLGAQGRGPWLEVLDRYVDLLKTRNPDQIMQLIDRMNNLQHSNGLFMEQFPSSVQKWYGKFLDRKYSARDSWTLAGFIPDTDLRDIVRWYDRPLDPTLRDNRQGIPEIELQLKPLSKGVNWREKGYPKLPGWKQPSRKDPSVQKNLDSVPSSWDHS